MGLAGPIDRLIVCLSDEFASGGMAVAVVGIGMLHAGDLEERISSHHRAIVCWQTFMHGAFVETIGFLFRGN